MARFAQPDKVSIMFAMSGVDVNKVLVIVPTYNEAENVEPIVGRLRAAVPEAHVLVADDNSPDGTGQLADRLADADDHVHVLHRQGKEGLGAAYLAGFAWGLERGFDVLVEHDADGSHQPEQLPRLLDALATADMVKGSRYVPGGSVVNWPKYRELLSRGGSLWTRWMTGIPLKDITGGFNAFRADTLRAIMPRITSEGYNFQVDLTWQTLQQGMTVVEVPIDFIERERGESKMSGRIVVEALFKTTAWGLRYRLGQVARLVTRPKKSPGRSPLG
jgi:dolichol-phosphate mannosyltransferase